MNKFRVKIYIDGNIFESEVLEGENFYKECYENIYKYNKLNISLKDGTILVMAKKSIRKAQFVFVPV